MKKIFNIIIGLGILLAMWEGVVMTGRYEKSLLPSPFMVLSGIMELASSGMLAEHIQASMLRFSIGYLSAVVSGVILGLFLGWFVKIWGFVDPIVQVLRPVSPIAWFPFIVLWFGIGDIPAIVIIFIAAFFPVLLSTVSAVRKIDGMYLKVARDFDIKQFNVLTKIVFPASFPYIANGIHIALGSSWVFLVAGEMVGAQSGLGFMIIDARNSIRSDLVLAGIIIIGLIGLLLDKAIKLLEKWIEKQWGTVQDVK